MIKNVISRVFNKKAKFFDKGPIAKYKRIAIGKLRNVEIISKLKSLDESLATRRVTNHCLPALSRSSFSIRVPAGNGEKGGDN